MTAEAHGPSKGRFRGDESEKLRWTGGLWIFWQLLKFLAACLWKWKLGAMVARHTVSRSGSRKRITFVVVAILSAMALGWFIIRRDGPAALKAGEIDMIQIALAPGRGEPPPPLVTSSDPAAISALVEALRDTSPQEDHKCRSSGIIKLIPSNGPTIQLEFLPGHDEGWYEVRFNEEAYRIPRAPFVDAMRSLQVNIPLECY